MRRIVGLTYIACKNAKPADKSYKLFHGGGLFLEVEPSGRKVWRMKFRHDGKESRVKLGEFPAMGVAAAVAERDQHKSRLRSGVTPVQHRDSETRSRKLAAENSFETVAREWFANRVKSGGWVETHSGKVIARLERDVFPWLGTRPISAITAPEVLTVLRRIEDRGALDTAHRAKQDCGAVFRFAIHDGRAERDPTADLRGALPPAKGGHFATITEPKAIGELLRAIDGYSGTYTTRCALKLAPLVFVRPGELRHAEWSEIDLERAEWRIPGEKMKAGDPHIVPLSQQALAVLAELKPLTGDGRYLFPSERTGARPMSENTVLAALRRMGYATDQMSGHGFRAMASALLNEQGWNRDAIERQLAHAERNRVRASYNFAEHLPERRKMMQAWADYLDRLRENTGKVVAIGRAA
jgi:integrase